MFIVFFGANFTVARVGGIMLVNQSALDTALEVIVGKLPEADGVVRPLVCNMATLRRIVSISRSMVYEKLNEKSRYYDPNFPKPFTLKGSRNYWLLSEVHAYILSMASKRKNGGAA